jgi:hypothetical protein
MIQFNLNGSIKIKSKFRLINRTQTNKPPSCLYNFIYLIEHAIFHNKNEKSIN